MEEALNLVKHHQYISKAVDGKKQRKGTEASVNAVQSPSEARIEQLIASALKDFASQLPRSPQIKSQSTPIKTDQMLDKEKKNPIKCFFCKNFGHMKKDCRSYKKWLEKQESKADNLNDKGLDGKTT